MHIHQNHWYLTEPKSQPILQKNIPIHLSYPQYHLHHRHLLPHGQHYLGKQVPPTYTKYLVNKSKIELIIYAKGYVLNLPMALRTSHPTS